MRQTSRKQVWTIQKAGKVRQFRLFQLLPEPTVEVDRLLKLRNELLCDARVDIFENPSQYQMDEARVLKLAENLYPADPRGSTGFFGEGKHSELDGLITRGAFEIVPRAKVPGDANINTGRFVLAIQYADTQAPLHKACFVVQGQKEKEKHCLIYNSSTVRPTSVRLLVSVAVMGRYVVWSFHVTQVYLKKPGHRHTSGLRAPTA